MSFLLRSSRPVTATHFLLKPTTAAIRPFSASSILTLKESDKHEPDQTSKYEAHKQDLLQKQKDGKGHWKPELASDSEEAVWADRHEHKDHSAEGLKDLQDKTKGEAEKTSRAGTSQQSG